MRRLAVVSPAFLLLAAVSVAVHAQACSSTVTASMVLTADMACPAGVDGFIVGADNVRIDLNGYRITGPQGTGTVGIRSSGFSGVKIVGPGAISGFASSIVMERGGQHEIREVDAASVSSAAPGHGILLRDVWGSVVEKSRVGLLHLSSGAGRRADGNRIAYNEATGIDVFGCDATRNEIVGNQVRFPATFAAVGLVGGAKGNVVMGNRIEGGTVWIGGASENVVEGNSIVNPTYPSYLHAGVLVAQHWSPCSGLGLTPVPARENVVRQNGISGAYNGVSLREGAIRNTVVDNKIYDPVAVGLYFAAGADGNDASPNWYRGAPVDVVDLGSGNRWP